MQYKTNRLCPTQPGTLVLLYLAVKPTTRVTSLAHPTDEALSGLDAWISSNALSEYLYFDASAAECTNLKGIASFLGSLRLLGGARRTYSPQTPASPCSLLRELPVLQRSQPGQSEQ